ncbi:MAG TPA: DUF2924 domain-containing protein [Cyanobacteria bacterium UBA9971]|nr:DUF2924 domain-containing protein [Cyanobacteria bacterium UBA9971]
MQETIEQLQHLSREELIKKWKKLFKTNSPQHARKEFLIKHIVWELQAKKQGGYTSQTQKQLDKLADKLASKQEVSKNDIKETTKQTSTFEIKPGTMLIREYKGEKQEVIALEKGFEYQNRQYKSLSGIAKEITGTQWNGKLFFGVKK